MTPSAAFTKRVRYGAAVAGLAGILVFAGCSAETDASEETPAAATSESSSTSTARTTAASTGKYADGTYTASGSYQTPETVETISVTLTLDNDVITEVNVIGDPQARETQQYQGQFIGGISDVVVGKNIDEISVSRVAGSSLTSKGFNSAVDKIKSEASS
ncbi:MAG: FMN-binding protein [Propionibacterium sp.]|uniref:FMN-binding domain-containing protein n=1 Tax=Brooklawnia propionicigenes TaxID=3041175 RepID=A0AAN0MEE6_9ACTN|nr:FMN-binding protein [Brooklawnia sp. SH051]MEA5121946.1 FMN-binding protein [Propionibacterium sp.]NLI86499.1 FMN-binding protein [Propionibacterium sp.]BEH00734.1 hypothetical protein brsh051_00150 [Brooklawnia sp. SH051]